MQLSELIAQLKTQLETHGDVRVMLRCEANYVTEDISETVVENFEQEPTCFVEST